MTLRVRGLAAGLALILAACATTPLQRPAQLSSMAQLPGWNAENHVAAFAAVRQACAFKATRSRFCLDVVGRGGLGEDAARTFLETHLRAEPIDGEGLLTAYFSPRYEARASREGEFTAPLRPPPADPGSAPDRAAIDRSPAPDALAWMRPEDLFFLQVQGSGVPHQAPAYPSDAAPMD